MAVIPGVTIDFTDYSNPGTPRIANIPDSAGDVTVEDLWDTYSEIAAELDNLIYKKLIDRPKGGGRAVLSATKSVGITLMQNNLQTKFPDQPGPAYITKRVIDGNLLAQDHLAAQLEPLANSSFTNWKNEADVSAAILTDIPALITNQYLAVGGVHVDPINGVAGTALGIGLPDLRSNNLTDAKVIAETYGLESYIFHNDITLNANHIEWHFEGHGGAPIVNLAGFNITGSEFHNCTMSGSGGGSIRAVSCILNGVSGVRGLFDNCGLNGTVTITSGQTSTFSKCYSFVPGQTTPILDLGDVGGSASVNVRAYSGGLELRNMTKAGDKITVELTAGHVKIDATCTNGTIVVRGVGKLTNNAGVGVTVDDTGLVEGWRSKLIYEILHNRYSINTVNGVMTITLDDGTTITSTAYKDSALTQPWDGSGSILGRDEFV